MKPYISSVNVWLPFFLLASWLAVHPETTFGQGNRGSAAGVFIDADRTLRLQYVPDPQGTLTEARRQAARNALDAAVAKGSTLRKVSLTRLEKAVEKAIEEGREPTEEMLHLAGLLRVQYVFFYPETKEIVIAGPAEGWMRDAAENVCGMTTGRPTLRLDDLVVALRAFPPGKHSNPAIGCSIDPTEEGLLKMRQFLNMVGRAVSPQDEQFLVKGLKNSLGLQTVSVLGIPGSTHFAHAMVEADYRMKLIGIGLERPAAKIQTYIELANPATVARNTIQRWYFTPNYDCVRISDDKQAMELVGQGVKLVSQDELVAENGGRVETSNSNAASKRFVESFTKHYDELAQNTLIYAQLRNLIDLSVMAAFIQRQDLYGQADWKMLVFANEKLFEVETQTIPLTVESTVNSVWKGQTLMTPVGGGVEIHPTRALDVSHVLPDTEQSVQKRHAEVQVKIPADRWWWD